MNYLELQTEILNLIYSGSSDVDAMVPSLVNDAILAISLEDGIVLPSLKKIVSVNTVEDQYYTTLPATLAVPDYDSKLRFASVGGVPVQFDYILEEMLTEYDDMDEIGDVEAVCLEGQTLYYAKQPATATAILLLLYKKPTILSATTDIPTDIPLHLHRDLIVRKAAAIAFDMMEQGEDGQKVNTLVQQEFYKVGLNKLRVYLGARRRHLTRSIWNQ